MALDWSEIGGMVRHTFTQTLELVLLYDMFLVAHPRPTPFSCWQMLPVGFTILFWCSFGVGPKKEGKEGWRKLFVSYKTLLV